MRRHAGLRARRPWRDRLPSAGFLLSCGPQPSWHSGSPSGTIPSSPVAESPAKYDRKSRYTEGRGIAGAFEGETVTRRRLMEGTALAVGGIATMAFTLPALGFALGPIFEDTNPTRWEDVGPEDDFNDESYVPRVISIDPEIGDAGKTTVYVRKFARGKDKVIEGQ